MDSGGEELMRRWLRVLNERGTIESSLELAEQLGLDDHDKMIGSVNSAIAAELVTTVAK